jgi:hypothetical protein
LIVIDFWYFWLAIQNTTTSQARSLFRAMAVFISFCLWRALQLLLRQLRFFAAAASAFTASQCIDHSRSGYPQFIG